MRIGIVIAIERELKSFLESEYTVKEINEDNRVVYSTVINNNEVYATKSGYGEIDAASATQYLITKYKVEIILNFGVTGALVRGLDVADLFVARGSINHDYDVSPIDPVKVHQYEEFKDEVVPFDEGLINLAKKICPELKECLIASGDAFIEKKEDKDRLALLNCTICDMESVAIARTSYLNKVKALSIKCISDNYEGNGGDFNTNVRNSADKAFNILDKILKQL